MKYLPSPEDYHKYYYIDIETELIPARGPIGVQIIWMMCASNFASNDVLSFIGHLEIKGFFDSLRGQEVYFVGHNSISFDGPVVARLVGAQTSVSNVVDTLVLSYLYDPRMPLGHSLGAWGERLQDTKGEFDDFSGYSLEMDKYCQQDVKLGKKVAKALWQRMRRLGFSELSCQIEHEIREVIDEQQTNGWYFDIPGAQSLVSKLRFEQSELEPAILELFPRKLAVVGTYQRRTTKSGSDYASYVRHCVDYPEIQYNDDGTYSTLDWREFNIGSPKQRVERLLDLGWEPQSFTKNGFPQVDEESLLAFCESSGRPEAGAIAEWLVLQGRASMIDGWLNNVNYDTSLMHGKLLTCGANSRRMTHYKPNTANIPKAKPKVKYGTESRKLWRARPGRKEVGTDASGLELRMFAQYLNDPIATKLYTEGDPHMFNTRLLEEPDEYRDLAVKNVIYAMLYGAQDKKLGKTARTSISNDKEAKAHGKWVRSRLEDGIPGFKRLTAEVQDEFKHTGGLLRTIDGGFVRCPSVRASLNYKLQPAGAIVMKVAAIESRKYIKKQGLDWLAVGNIHDEFQDDCHERDAQIVGQLRVKGIEDAGEILGCHVPLTGKYSVGDNWSECH